jgi:GNAT superfamily N-acetyltransferase
MARDLVDAANANLRVAYVRLAEAVPSGATRRFGPLVAPATGLPVPMFNRVLAFEAPSPDDLSTAVGWLDDRDVPFWVTAVEPVAEALDGSLADLGLVETAEHPGMAMAPLDGLSPGDPPADIGEVTDPTGLDAFCSVAASVFGTPPGVAERIYRAALAADGERLFLARVDGEPVACGLLIRSGDVAGVYTIGVVETHRRQGLGAAMTRAVLRAGREAGCEVGVLQSSEMASPLYRDLGFETVVTYHQFEPEG